MGHPLKMAPGPSGSRILGNLRAFRRDVLRLLLESARQFGDVVRFRLGPEIVHLVNHPGHIEHVLQKNQQNYDKRTRSAAKLRGICGESLLTSDGDTWRRQRRLIQPAFHYQRIANFAATMVETTVEMLERWEKLAQEAEPFDLASEMSRVTYTIVGRTLFGADVSANAKEVEGALEVVLEHTYHRLEKLLDLPLNFPSPANRRFQHALGAIDQVVYGIISERRKTGGRKEDLLSMLLEARDEETGQGMSDEQLRNETITLLLAGHETTANALSWTFYLLSQFPEVEDQLRTEVASVLDGRTPVLEELPRLNYTTMVINESLRLYPPIWIYERHAVADDVIEGYHIPAGSTVVISPFVLHRHPVFWERPEIFDPTRFADEALLNRSGPAYLPFGAGPHLCIGNNFAMMEARIILAMVAQRYRIRLRPGHPVEPKPGITLRPRHGLLMTAQKLNN